METSKQSNFWVIKNLWKRKAKIYAQIPLLDSVFTDYRSPTGYRWLFTDSAGFVKQKISSNCTIENILNFFLQGKVESGAMRDLDFYEYSLRDKKQDNVYVATHISNAGFKPMLKGEFITNISIRAMANEEMIQHLSDPLGDASSKLVLSCRVKDGRYLYRFYKRYGLEETKEIILTADNLCYKLRVLGDKIISVLEKNTRQKVLEIVLYFLEDKNRNIWLMGSPHCLTQPKLNNTSRSYANLIGNSQDTFTSARNNTSNGVTSPRSVLNTEISRDSLTFTISYHKNETGCRGDLCNFYVKSKATGEEQEVDYDKALERVKKAFSKEGYNDILSMKLEHAFNTLLRSKEKERHLCINKEIPYYYILLGRQLFRKTGVIPDNHVPSWELNLRQLQSKYKNTDPLSEQEMLELSRKNPFQFYHSVKVCDRCYEVYQVLRSSMRPRTHGIPLTTSPKETPRPNTVFSRLSTLKSSSSSGLATFQRTLNAINYVQTPIGKVNKNSIDDMLLDMNHALIDMEAPPIELRKEIAKFYGSRTQYARQQRRLDILRSESKSKPILSPKAEDEKMQEDVLCLYK
jgi:hypothetical protein